MILYARRITAMFAITVMVLILALAACGGGKGAGGGEGGASPDAGILVTPSVSSDVEGALPDASPSVSGTSESPPDSAPDAPTESNFLDGDDFPAEKEIVVTREGMSESYTATLKVSDLGYAIYVLPGFEFSTSDSMDLILYRSDSENATLPRLMMGIKKHDPSATPAPPTTTGGNSFEFSQVNVGGALFDVFLSYAEEEPDGRVVLMAMLDTMTS